MPISIFGGVLEPIVVLGDGPRLSSFLCIAGERDGPRIFVDLSIAGESKLIRISTTIDDYKIVRTSVFIDSSSTLMSVADIIEAGGTQSFRRLHTFTTVSNNAFQNDYISIDGSSFSREKFPIDSEQRKYHTNLNSSGVQRSIWYEDSPNGAVVSVDRAVRNVIVQKQDGVNQVFFKYPLSFGTLHDFAASDDRIWFLFIIDDNYKGAPLYSLRTYDIVTGELISDTKLSNFLMLGIDLQYQPHLQLKSHVQMWHFLKMEVAVVLADYVRTTCDFRDDLKLKTEVVIDADNTLESSVALWTGQWKSGGYRRKVNIAWTAEHTLQWTNLIIDVTAWGSNWWGKLKDNEDFSIYLDNIGLLPSVFVGNIETQTGYLVVRLDTVIQGQTYDFDFFVYWNNVDSESSVHPSLRDISGTEGAYSEMFGDSATFVIKNYTIPDENITFDYLKDWLHAVRYIRGEVPVGGDYPSVSKLHFSYKDTADSNGISISVGRYQGRAGRLRVEFMFEDTYTGDDLIFRELNDELDLLGDFYTLSSTKCGVEARAWTSAIFGGAEMLKTAPSVYVPEDTIAKPISSAAAYDSGILRNAPEMGDFGFFITPASPTTTESSIEIATVGISSVLVFYDENTIRSCATLVWQLLKNGPKLAVSIRRHDSVTLKSPELIACTAINVTVEIQEIDSEFLSITCSESKVWIIAKTDSVYRDGFGLFDKFPTETDPFIKRTQRTHIYTVDKTTKMVFGTMLYVPLLANKIVRVTDAMKFVFVSKCSNSDKHDPQNTIYDYDLLILDFDGTILYEEESAIYRPSTGYQNDAEVHLSVSPFGLLLLYRLYVVGSGAFASVYPYYYLYDTFYAKYASKLSETTYLSTICGLGYIDIIDAISVAVEILATEVLAGVTLSTCVKATSLVSVKTTAQVEIGTALNTSVDVFTRLAISTKPVLRVKPYREVTYIHQPDNSILVYNLNSDRELKWNFTFQEEVSFGIPEGSDPAETISYYKNTLQCVVDDKYMYGTWVSAKANEEQGSYIAKYDLEARKVVAYYHNRSSILSEDIFHFRLLTINYSETMHWCFVSRECSSDDYSIRYYDVLVLDEALTVVTALQKFEGVPENYIVYSVSEHEGTFYLLARKYVPNQDGGTYALFSDSDETRIYTTKYVLGTWELFATVPYNFDYGGVIWEDQIFFLDFHQFTKTHIWLNDQNVNGIGVRFDTQEIDVINGLLGFVYNIYEKDAYSLVVIKDHISASKRFTSGRLSKIEILNGVTLDPIVTPLFENNISIGTYSKVISTNRSLSYTLKIYDWIKTSVTLQLGRIDHATNISTIGRLDNNGLITYG